MTAERCTCSPYFGCSEYAPDCPRHGRKDTASPLSAERQRAAMERNLGGGLAGYIQRIRRAHGPLFNGDSYVGCRCGEFGCGNPLLLAHMDDLIRAYEAKVHDLAEETRRSSARMAGGQS